MRVRLGNRRGSNLIEFSLFVPWFIFLFVGIFDFGFYTYALESTTAGAVAAANYCVATGNCSSASHATACQLAIDSVQFLSNVGTGSTSCSSPISMSVTDPSLDTYGNQFQSVTFAYTTPILIPIPGLLPDQVTITRTVVLTFGQTV